ncbi:sulfatase [Bacteroidota bacterium]
MKNSPFNTFVSTLLVSICFAVALLHSCDSGDKKDLPPNIVILFADDLGWNQLGCQGGPYQTPAIDGLAAQGMRFTDAYASCAVCSPTRAALMTGKYPARLHLTDFIAGGKDKLLSQPQWQKFLPLEEITLGEVFKEHGYKTAIFGKWHLSQEKKPPGSEPYNPDKQGFDEYMVTYKPVKDFTNPEWDPHNIDSITERSIRFLEENRNNPFFLIVSHNAIHDPLMESSSRIDEYKKTDPFAEYHVDPKIGAMLSRLDEGAGRVLGKLDELGLQENTIVFFISDNGGRDKHASQLPFRKGKGWLYEGGIRVPMIVSWPGRIKSGTTDSTLTATIDVFPTLLDLAGIKAANHPIDGNSIADILLGKVPGKNRTQYWHYPHYHAGSGMKPASALRKGKYKLIEWHEELLQGYPALELYDLESDPGETHDISAEKPELLEELRNDLHHWRNEVGAQMPTLN